MKHQVHILIVIVAILIGMTACKKTGEVLLEGTWHLVINEDIDSGTINHEGTITYNDSTYSMETNAIITIHNAKLNEQEFLVKYGVILKTSGEYMAYGEYGEDKGIPIGKLIHIQKFADVKMTFWRCYNPSDGTLIDELTGSELTENSNEFARQAIPTLLRYSESDIIMLREDKFVTKDSAGTITFTRIKQE